ncbi:RHS repeat-associated protein [Tahibacter aquaticus]|uniref:RHS repeat-associated protein n=1 Tax=Tahibacter aquaticus TaxID=520092 RepID=A0A4R6YPJ8_9GAMM|nr:RHS repeat-associated core domain-containing protein [Tahibacter aquaticus]TDR39672.1 RHS repeat-associated protein [Tahibacter aquaticus]
MNEPLSAALIIGRSAESRCRSLRSSLSASEVPRADGGSARSKSRRFSPLRSGIKWGRFCLCVLFLWLLALPASAAERTRSFVYNARNQLTDVIDTADPGRSIRFTYDASGNRESKTQAGSTTTYRWDARDRLVEVLRDGVWVARYDYNAAGQRTFKEVNGPSPTAVRYVYDGANLIAETNVIGNTLATYTRAADGRLLSMRRGNQAYSYLLDGLGTPIALLSADGAVVSRYRVDAWGNPLASVGTVANPFGYTGYPIDDESGLFYANARYYDSELGAFLSEDPAAGDPTRPITFHPYIYANGNPLVYLDRSGRTAELVEVLDGHERNQAEIVALAEQIKSMRATAMWYERPFVELGFVGTVLLTAGNRLGQGVITGANAGANVALNAADTYLVDLGEGADPANAEIAAFADDGFAAAEAAYHDPRSAAYGAMAAAAEPYQKAYDGDTGVQLDLAASLDPRRLSQRVMRGMAPTRGPPAASHQASYVVEGADGRPQLATLGATMPRTAPPAPMASMYAAVPAAPSLGPPPAARPPLGVNDPPQRYQGPWTQRDLARAQLGQGPLDFVPLRDRRGREVPLELHHADQMPGSAIHEVNAVEHRQPGVHGQPNQGVTPEMRKADAQLHWQTRGQQMGNPPPEKDP